MQIINDAILNKMIETGRLPQGSKIEIQSITGEPYSNYVRIEILGTKKRCRKPFVYWNICVDIARELIYWDTSTFYYL